MNSINKFIYGAITIAVAVVVMLFFKYDSNEYYPVKLFAACPHLPVSKSEESNGVIVKVELSQSQAGDVLGWYARRGVSLARDSVQTNGYGPDGISFMISGTNQVLRLTVSQWKDF